MALNLDAVVEAGKAQGEILVDLPTPVISDLMFSLVGLPATTQKLMSPEAVCRLSPDEMETMTA